MEIWIWNFYENYVASLGVSCSKFYNWMFGLILLRKIKKEVRVDNGKLECFLFLKKKIKECYKEELINSSN